MELLDVKGTFTVHYHI